MPEPAPPTIFSKQRRAARAARALARQQAPDAARFLLDEIVDDIVERLAFMRFEPARALVIGDVTGRLTAALEQGGADVTRAPTGELDEEHPLPGPLSDNAFDLIASIAALDTVNDLPGALIHMRHALAPGGLTIAALPAAGSLPKLRAAMLVGDGERPAARIHPMVDAQSGAALMQRAGFTRQVADSFTVRASYTGLRHLVSDLRDQGLGSVLASHAPPLGKRALERAEQAFAKLAGDNGRTIETFEILILTSWKT